VSDGVLQALAGGAVTIIGAAFVYFGVRFTARQSTKAKKEEVEAGAYTRAQGIWEAATTRQDKELTRLAAALDEQEERHRRLDERHRQEIAELREERREQIAALNSRIDELEARDDASRQRIQALEAREQTLGSYIRTLIGVMRENKIDPPPAPPGMTFD
jgi:septal ring factor EnvC (AmiA/AmiB activator)